MLTIYKASAGSGKTFRLVVEYLKLVLADPQAFRHVLAVTFTNKATAEMKERILEHLGRMANDQPSGYMEKIMEEVGYPEGEIRERASKALGQLLFDYDRFAVSTIDKFTQRVLKAFNKELGVNPAYQIETDSKLLVAEAADRLIAGISARKELFRWLESFIRDKINNSRSFEIGKDLTDLGQELFRERLQNLLGPLTAFFEEGNQHREYLAMLQAIVARYENTLKKMAAELVGVYREAGLSVDDFAYKATGVAGFLERTAAGAVPPEIPARSRKASEEAEAWATRSNPRYAEVTALAAARLQPGLNRLVAFYEDQNRPYLTARVILAEWYTAAVLADLNSEIASLSREKGILPLASSNLLLKGVIDGSDTPFLYEKMGSQYHHFMLDEFQDTSEMQWENFRPLVANSMAGGFRNLVVGDVKQSIYRWRNSNWDILDRQVAEDFRGFPIKNKALVTNYRSRREVIRFNNLFFKRLPQIFAGSLRDVGAPEDYIHRMLAIYDDAEQQFAGSTTDPGGFVALETIPCEEGEFMERSLQRLTGQIRTLYAHGYQAGDIAILVRKKEHGARIVTHFLNEASLPENQDLDLRVISADSLLLKSSPGVQFIIALFRHLQDREDLLIRAVLLHLWKSFNGKGIFLREAREEFDTLLAPLVALVEAKLPVSGLDEMIIRIASVFGLMQIGTELPFIRTLADKVSALRITMTGGIPEFLTWWEETGSDLAVSVNEETDAIRLLTIHKAKGLEFRVVLVPFPEWKVIDQTKKNILWCVPGEAPFDQAPLVPVNYSDKLAGTIFSEAYFREHFSLLVDNLNLVYVAFTRAAEVLWVNLPPKNEKGRIGHFITGALAGLVPEEGMEAGVTRETGVTRDTSGTRETSVTSGEGVTRADGLFTFGSLPNTGGQAKRDHRPAPQEWVFHDFSERLHLRTGSDDFLTVTTGGSSAKNLGKLVHAILAGIRHAGELEAACTRALAAGELQPHEYEPVKTQLAAMLEHPIARKWFLGDYRILNEATLLSPDLTLRPDRIMIAGEQAIVADYKSGEVRSDSHRKQVVRYCQTLQKAGFREVTGYIWYVRENDLLQVYPQNRAF